RLQRPDVRSAGSGARAVERRHLAAWLRKFSWTGETRGRFAAGFSATGQLMKLNRLARTLAVGGGALGFILTAAAESTWVSTDFRDGDFALVRDGAAATIVYSPQDFKVVDIAAHDLALDLERVTGIKPAVRTNLAGASGPVVLIGTLGRNPTIDALAAS